MSMPEAARSLPLASAIGVALDDPASIVERQKIRGQGAEPMKGWRIRAVWEVLEEYGIDPHQTWWSEAAREAAEQSDVPTGSKP
jgi:hypothetical protein